MLLHLGLMTADEAFSLVKQRQHELRLELEADRAASRKAHRRFRQMFLLRRALHRWVPSVAARILH